MRYASLRTVLIACTALAAGPVLAQEAAPASPPVAVPDPAPPSPPLIVIAPPEVAPAPTIEAIPAVWAPAPRDAQGRSAYGLYLSARLALSRGEAEAGARFLAETEALTPEQPSVRDQAFTAALLAGDLDIAARIAPEGPATPRVISEAGALVSVVQTYVNGDARAAHAALKTRPVQSPHARAAALVAPWIAAAAGDWEAALAPAAPSDPVGLLFGRFHRAELLERRRRYAEAEAELRGLATDVRGAPLFRAAYGEYLERRGRRDEALAFYDTTLAALGGQDPGITAARARLMSRGRPAPLVDLKEGAARALMIAARQASAEGSHEFAAVYLRLSINLKPEPESLYLLGQALAQAKLAPASRAVFAQVPRTSPALYTAAQIAIGLSHAEDEQSDAALAAFEAARAASAEDPRVAYLYASQLVQMERYEEALELLNGPLLATESQGPEIRFMRGAAYESLDRVPEAEAELWAALQAQPDEPIFLNYLGYLWVDSGTRVVEGAEMIARAHAASPEDGNIQDSLGWAQYRQGQYEIAVETLEQAVAKLPANAEINDHLGDAYWQVGRRREAGFQWTRVLTLDTDDARRASVQRKLEGGLEAGDAS